MADEKIGEYYQAPKALTPKNEPRRYDPPKKYNPPQVKTLPPKVIVELMEMFRAYQSGEISNECYKDFLDWTSRVRW